MTTKRLIRKKEAQEVAVDDTVVQEYFSQTVPNLGLSTATMNGTYPPEHKGVWALNEHVDEMFYVLAGTAKIIFQDGETIELEPESAAHMPLGLKYRVEDAQGLRVVVATGPAWSPGQHKWTED